MYFQGEALNCYSCPRGGLDCQNGWFLGYSVKLNCISPVPYWRQILRRLSFITDDLINYNKQLMAFRPSRETLCPYEAQFCLKVDDFEGEHLDQFIKNIFWNIQNARQFCITIWCINKFWLEFTSDLKSTFLNYILKTLFRDTPLPRLSGHLAPFL